MHYFWLIFGSLLILDSLFASRISNLNLGVLLPALLGVPMAMNQSCYALKSDEIAAPYYLFFALNKEIASLKAISNGGVFNTIIVKTFDSIHIAIPSNDLIATFETLVTPIMEQIQVKTKENFTLSEVRDRLLPKLMSGEVEV